MQKSTQIKDICTKRWLKPQEIIYLLKEHSLFEDLKTEQLPKRPDTGSIFIVTNTKKAKWKDDGYEYTKRNNGRGFKESSEILTLNGKKMIACLYSNISEEDVIYQQNNVNNQFVLEPSQNNFKKTEDVYQRRIFKLMKEYVTQLDCNEDIVIIQYLKKNKMNAIEKRLEPHNINSKKLSNNSDITDCLNAMQTDNFEYQSNTFSNTKPENFAENEQQSKSYPVQDKKDNVMADLFNDEEANTNPWQYSDQCDFLKDYGNDYNSVFTNELDTDFLFTNSNNNNIQENPAPYNEPKNQNWIIENELADLQSNDQQSLAWAEILNTQSQEMKSINQNSEANDPDNKQVYKNVIQNTTKIEELEKKLKVMMEKLKLYEESEQNSSICKTHHEKTTISEKQNSSLKQKSTTDKSKLTDHEKTKFTSTCDQYDNSNIIKEIRSDISGLKESFNSFIQESNLSHNLEPSFVNSTNLANNFNPKKVENANTETPKSQCSGFKSDYWVKIIDFTPEFDYTSGGAKMIVCCEMENEASSNDNIEICFEDVTVNATLIQKGVLKCYVPPSDCSKKVNLQVIINGNCVSYRSFELFEYKKKKTHGKKKNVIQCESDDNIVDRAFKVRLIDRLNFMNEVEGGNHSNLLEYSNKGDNNFSPNKDKMKNIVNKFDDEECLNAINTIVEGIKDSCGEDKVKELLDEPDQHGFYIIHYLTKLGFFESIKTVIKYGADINVKYNNSITPLHIAFSSKNKQLIEYLATDKLMKENLKYVDQKDDEGINTSNDRDNVQNQNYTLMTLIDNQELLEALLREVTLDKTLSYANANNTNSVTDSFISAEPSIEPQRDNADSLDISYSAIINMFEEEKDSKNSLSSKDNQDEEKHRSVRESKKQSFRKSDRRKRRVQSGVKGVSNENQNSLNFSREQIENLKESTINDPNELINIQTYKANGELNNQVVSIQKNVKGWLRRRQYKDIKLAVNVLQNYMKEKFLSKKSKENSELSLKLNNQKEKWLKKGSTINPQTNLT